MAQSKELSLNELCKICHTNVPKYKCPRCSLPTCSLPCSKRHKIWSQCSGVRDPAAYLKRKDLATPAAFDKDFNFISGIERHLERADRAAENRGVELGSVQDEEGRKKKGHGLVKGEVPLRRAYERSGVNVVHAPKGLSRNKRNMTHWHKRRKHINWTTEWIWDDGQKAFTRCFETATIASCVLRVTDGNRRSKDEKQTETGEETLPQSKKRKLDPVQKTEDEAEPPTTIEMQGEQDTRSREPSRTLTPEPGPELEPKSEETTETHTSPDTQPQTATNQENKRDLPPNTFIYLHRPRTRSHDIPVLTPLSPSATLSDSLRGQTVLEFPTFYILPYPPTSLPDGKYILEETYLQRLREAEEEELRDAGEARNEESEEEEGEVRVPTPSGDGKALGDFDEKKVWEVLRMDLQG